MFYLYKITNQLNSKVYIGQAIDAKKRWSQHKYFAKYRQVQYIHRAMAKYGIENFIYEIIACSLTQNDADETETQLIKQYDSRNSDKGYNIASVGDSPWNRGLKGVQIHSSKTREKMSKSHMGKPKTKEHSKNISLGKRGHIVSQETRNKIAATLKGRKLSKEHKAKISAGMRNNA